eukprot:scaffold118644_cov71-Phaeocystis_antarctica.AAC.1
MGACGTLAPARAFILDHTKVNVSVRNDHTADTLPGSGPHSSCRTIAAHTHRIASRTRVAARVIVGCPWVPPSRPASPPPRAPASPPACPPLSPP